MTEEKRLLNDFTEEDFKNLDITDDFLFYSTLSKNMELCRELLEIILNQKIRKVKLIQAQKSIKHSYDGKGVRLDVYVDDDEQTVYDIEMQATSNKNLSKRSRYYQGMIDLNLIKKGEDYKILRKSYVIFICTFDPFGRELYRYEFENRCVDALDIRLEDETTKVFLNPYGKDQKISQELKDFLEYLVTHKCNSAFTKWLDEEVKSIMKNEEWRLEYMTLNMRDRENIEAGRKEGRREGRDETIRIMLLNNKTPEEIADFTSIPIEVVKEVECSIKNYKAFQ